MAIALDAIASSTDQTASPITWNHTCTGSNLLLVVSVHLTGTLTTPPSASAVTYNGVSMNKVRTDTNTATASHTSETTIWLLHAPATGSNQVSVSFTGGTAPHVCGNSTSYTGAQQSDTADATTGGNGSGNADQQVTITTVADNCWVVSASTLHGAGAQVADQTQRGLVTLSGAVQGQGGLEDTNGVVTPAGNRTMGWTTSSSSLNQNSQSVISFAPVITTITINKSDTTATNESISVTPPYFSANESDATVTSDVIPSYYTDQVDSMESLNLTLVDTIHASDAVSTSESVQLLVTSIINVSTSVSAGESTGESLSYAISVNDTTATSELVKLLGTSSVAVNDSVTISESTTSDITVVPSVSDTSAISESIGIVFGFATSVSSSVTTNENVQLQIISFIATSDSVNYQEDAELQISQIIVDDFNPVNDYVYLLAENNISVSDTVTTSESLDTFPFFTLTESDTATTSELTQINYFVQIPVFDFGFASETVQFSLTSIIAVSSTTVASESIRLLVIDPSVVSDTTTTSENIQFEADSFAVLSDSIATDESSVVILGNLLITTNDSATTSEAITITEAIAGSNLIVEMDNVASNDSLSHYSDQADVMELIKLLISQPIAISDTVITSENLSLQRIITLSINVSNTTVTSESLLALRGGSYDLSLSIDYLFDENGNLLLDENGNPLWASNTAENVTISENVVVLASTYNLSISDLVQISENIRIAAPSVFIETEFLTMVIRPLIPLILTDDNVINIAMVIK